MSTFLAVTAAWSFAAAILWLTWLFRCKHHWELVDKTEIPSRIEELSKHTPNEVRHIIAWDLPLLAKRRVVLAMRCSACGRAKIHTIDSA